jgi:hypothetical protein
LDPSENVYLVQLAWKGAGRLILEDKDKFANDHNHLTETFSDPLSHQGGLSPSLRRHSRYSFFKIKNNLKIIQNIMPVSLARQSCPAVLPGSLARQSCPAVLPGSLARQSYPAVLHSSLLTCLDLSRLV